MRRFSSFIPFFKGIAYYTLSVAPVVLAVEHAVAGIAYVEGKSMTPTLNAGYLPPASFNSCDSKSVGSVGIRPEHERDPPDSNEIVFIRKLSYKPAIGDVVVLDSPGKPGQQAVKRLIATEGDIVMYFEPTRKKSLETIRYEVAASEKLQDLSHSVLHANDEQMQDILEELNQYLLKKRQEDMDKQSPTKQVHKPLNVQGDSKANTNLPIDHTDHNTNINNSTNNDDNHYTNLATFTHENGKSSLLFEDVKLIICRVPQGYCWVEGDNPLRSRDSREYGPIPLALIRGGVVGVLWPPKLIGYIRPHVGSTTVIRIIMFRICVLI